MAISSRQAGAIVPCATCGQPTQVPLEGEISTNASHFVTNMMEQTAEIAPSLISSPISKENKNEDVDIDVVADQLRSATAVRPDRESMKHILSDQPDQEPFIPEELGGGDDHTGESPLTFRRHKNLDEEMDLTPMVDVTFQLLIFFMVSASFSLQKSIEVPTPDPDQKGASQQVQTLDDLQGTSIIVKIDSSNTIFIDDEPLGDVLRLSDTLRDKMRREQKSEILVTADSQSLHRTLIAVIDAANEVGMQKIRMTSRKRAD